MEIEMKRLFLPLLLLATAVLAQTTPNTANLSWTTPTTNTDGSAISGSVTFNVYESIQGSAPTGSPIATGLTAASDAISTGLADGSTDCFNVTAVVAGQQSAFSNQACKSFPAGTPNAPVLTVK
jgi:hypothetical protein